MTNKEILLIQIESMENMYIHTMRMYHAFLSERFIEIDQEKVYSDEEIKTFFENHSDLYET